MSNRREERKDLIVNTALELFLSKGYLNTKIIDIADAVGIGKGTVYEYFQSKEALLLEVLNQKVVSDYLYVQEIPALNLNCREKLTVFINFHCENYKKYGPNAFDLQQQLMKGDPDVSMEVIRIIHTIAMHMYMCVGNIIKEGISCGELRPMNADLAANAIIGAINSHLTVRMQKFWPLPPLPPEAVDNINNWSDEELLELIFSGLNINS